MKRHLQILGKNLIKDKWEVDGRCGEQLEACCGQSRGWKQGTSGYKFRTAAWGHFKMSLEFSDESFIFQSMNKDFSENSGA